MFKYKQNGLMLFATRKATNNERLNFHRDYITINKTTENSWKLIKRKNFTIINQIFSSSAYRNI